MKLKDKANRAFLMKLKYKNISPNHNKGKGVTITHKCRYMQ